MSRWDTMRRPRSGFRRLEALSGKLCQKRAYNASFHDCKGVPSTSDDHTSEICVRFSMLKLDNEC